MKEVINNIRWQEIKNSIGGFIFALVLNPILIMFLYYGIEEGSLGESWFVLLIIGAPTILIDYALIEKIAIIINPLKSDVFKKYGSPDKVATIINEIENTQIFNDGNIIIASKYICGYDDYTKLVACDNVLGAHKLVHKTNFVIDYYMVLVTDKYGLEIGFKYGKDEEDECDKIIAIIGDVCKNAKLGYTNEEQKHIERNRVMLEDKPEKDDMFICPDCGNQVTYGDKFCKNCACKLNWEDDV